MITLTSLALVLAPAVLEEPTPARVPGIEWEYGSIEDALAKAREQSGLALIYFWADGSEYCGKLYSETLATDTAANAVKGVVCYSAKHSDSTVALFERYQVRTLPTMLVVDADGMPEDIIAGFIPPDDFAGEIGRIRRGEGTRSGLAKQLENVDPKSVDGIDLRWLLVGKLQELGLTEQEEAQTEKIRQLDPDGNTDVGGQLKLNDLLNEATGDLSQLNPEEIPAALREVDFKKAYAFAKRAKSKSVRFNAWSSLARLEARREDYTAAAEAIRRSVKDADDDQRAGWCNAVAGWAVNNAERITSKERKYALDLAHQSVKLTLAHRKQAEKQKGDGDADGFELSDDALAQRMCVLAQVEYLNRQRDKARKTIEKAAELAHSCQIESIREQVFRVLEEINAGK